MPQLSELFNPITIGNCEIRNRILQSGHTTGYAMNGMPTDAHVTYYEARAKGGVGLIVMEACCVSPTTTIFGPAIMIHGFKDEIIPKMKEISDAVHAHGSKIFCQAWHIGNQGVSAINGIPTQSCSDVPSPAMGEVPVPMTEKDIKDIIQCYVDFSLRLKKAGFDGVELHCAHGYLPQQFLSPYVNNRKDMYGGSLENRMRFSMELIDAVRTAVGKDFVVGLRCSADELVQGGLTLDDMKEVCTVWDQTGQIDFLDITVGNYKTVAPIISPMMVPARPFVFLAAEIRQEVEVPVFTAIRINDPELANEIIKNNEADMVVMTRSLICDPELPNKAKADRLDDIRQCISCNEGCWEKVTSGIPITCAQNPEGGSSGLLQVTPAERKKKVMVVGGGPAGMEAAIVARMRGHEVTLYEKTDMVGGALLTAAKAPGRADLGQVFRFQVHEMERLGVKMNLGTEVTASFVLQEKQKPDVVIVATGATPIENPTVDMVGSEASIEIEEGTHVVTAEDILEGLVEAGQRVVVADQQTYLKGMETAEKLSDQGKDVILVPPLPIRCFAKNPYDIDGPSMIIQTTNCIASGVSRIDNSVVKRAMPGKVVIRNQYTDEEQEIQADTLVLSYWRKPERKLYEELDGKIAELYRIGDCVSPRRYIDAIREGYALARKI